MTSAANSVGMEREARNHLKTPPHEAVERLGAAEITGRRTWGGIDGSGHEDLTTVRHDDLRTVLSHLRQVEEREAVMREDAEADRAFHLEALGQIKAAIEYGDNPAMLIETAIRMASIAEVRERNEARALTHSPETDGEAS